ncbi:MAG: GIY-YIG nuclease family protein [Devosia sp.]|nr:GIY-YIG nuclease family protein [Devosia sp.]
MSTEGHFFVYLLASRKYGALYIGVTGNLPARVYIHREALIPSFTSRYRIWRLVYFEQHDTALAAITREKQMKKWRRDWKIALLERDNPDWRDLFEEIAS